MDIESGLQHVALDPLFSGLSAANLAIVLVDLKDCTIRDINPLFETQSGFSKRDIVGREFKNGPLFARYVHGEFPRPMFVRASDLVKTLVPTASTEDYTACDFQRVKDALFNGGSWKVVTRHMTRDGSVLECLNTLFLVRDQQNSPCAIMCISNPDQSRIVSAPSGFPAPAGFDFSLENHKSSLDKHSSSCQAPFNHNHLLPCPLSAS